MYCSRCNQDKSLDDFYDSQYQVKRGWCMECRSKAAREARLRNPVQYALADARRRSRQNHLAYNLTVEHLVEVWISQDGRCAVTHTSFQEIDPPRPPSLRCVDESQGYLCGTVWFVLPPPVGCNRHAAKNLINGSAQTT